MRTLTVKSWMLFPEREAAEQATPGDSLSRHPRRRTAEEAEVGMLKRRELLLLQDGANGKSGKEVE